MALQDLSFPLLKTRFIKAGQLIFKFKIRGGSSFSGEELTAGNSFNQELEQIIRAVLGNLDNLQPFSSAHFNKRSDKKPWEGEPKVMCKHHCKKLRAYPSILMLYLEKNTQNVSEKQAEEKSSPINASYFYNITLCNTATPQTEVPDVIIEEKKVAQQSPSVSEPRPKRRRRDSPLEDAILQDLMKDLEAESKVPVVRRHMNNSHAGEEVRKAPEKLDKRATIGFDHSQQKSDVGTVKERRSPGGGEVHPGTIQDMDEVDGEDADSINKTPVKPGLLTRLGRRIFPSSWFFKDT